MESLCAYDSSSSSEDNDESPQNKKQKASSTEVDSGGNGRGSGANIGQRKDKLLKVARTNFLARGVDHHRTSRVSIEARDLKPERLKQIWRRAVFFAQGHFCTVGDEIRIQKRLYLLDQL